MVKGVPATSEGSKKWRWNNKLMEDQEYAYHYLRMEG